MHKEEDQKSEQEQKSWVWSDCKLVLRRLNPNNPTEQSYENLQAEVELQSDDIKEPFIPQFRFSKQLTFNAKKGFSWKKGIPLPPLIIKLQKSYFDLLQQDEQIIMIYCELSVAYPKRKDSHFYLQQILTVGEKRKPFTKEGDVIFDGILMKESSMQKSNNKFLFVLSICASSIEQNKIILKTLISTTFYSQNTRITRHIKKSSQVKTIKLLSPTKFLKPFAQPIIQSTKQQCKETFIECFKYINRQSYRLCKQHPFYLIYHFYDLIKVYYRSEEVSNLKDVLETIFLNTQREKQGLENDKNSIFKYTLKKTKKIQKYNDNFNKSKKLKNKKIIEAQFNKTKIPERNLLLITFEQNILQFIAKQIQKEIAEKSQSDFQQQLERQIQQFNKIFSEWSFFYTKVDLLRKQSIESFWKNIQKECLFETYKDHYYQIYGRLRRQSKQAKLNRQTTDVS